MGVVYSGEVRGEVGTRSHMFFISQPEDGQCKGPKHVVLYVIKSIHISTTV